MFANQGLSKMSCIEANRSTLDWITILNDINLQKQYADAWKQKQRKNPSCISILLISF